MDSQKNQYMGTPKNWFRSDAPEAEEGQEDAVFRSCYEERRAGENHHPGQCGGKKEERAAEYRMVRGHQNMDWVGLGGGIPDSGTARSLEDTHGPRQRNSASRLREREHQRYVGPNPAALILAGRGFSDFTRKC